MGRIHEGAGVPIRENFRRTPRMVKDHSSKRNQKGSLRSENEKTPKCQTKKHELVFSQQAYEKYEVGG